MPPASISDKTLHFIEIKAKPSKSVHFCGDAAAGYALQEKRSCNHPGLLLPLPTASENTSVSDLELLVAVSFYFFGIISNVRRIS